jgi:DNA-binding beta-propeller fold protein YncE
MRNVARNRRSNLWRSAAAVLFATVLAVPLLSSIKVGEDSARGTWPSRAESSLPLDSSSAYAAVRAEPGNSEKALKELFARLPGRDVAPVRCIKDSYPEFNGLAVDPQNNVVAASDFVGRSLLLYSRTATTGPQDITPPVSQIVGPSTYISPPAGVALDPVRHEVYIASNDIGDDIAVFSYNDRGNAKARTLAVPHGTWGIALSQKQKEVAITVQPQAQIAIYRLGASGAEAPRREIRGNRTQLADPHGIFWDDQNDEIVVANHGNWSRGYWDADFNGGGQYRPPSITVFAASTKGDAAPVRIIEGSKTALNWPSGLSVDATHNEIVVTNLGNNSILVFGRLDRGNVAPLRAIAGPHTGIDRPIGVGLDLLHSELWIANMGHTIEVFPLGANGDATPLRIIRSAPAESPIVGIGLPQSVAFDSRRHVLLVPN